MISTGFEFLKLGLVALLIFVFVGYATTCRDEEILMEKEQESGGNEDLQNKIMVLPYIRKKQRN